MSTSPFSQILASYPAKFKNFACFIARTSLGAHTEIKFRETRPESGLHRRRIQFSDLFSLKIAAKPLLVIV